MRHHYIPTILFWTITIALIVVAAQTRAVRADQLPDNNPLTLARARQIAVENNPTLTSALERINQARQAIIQARADYFPTISVGVGMDYRETTDIAVAGYDEHQYTSQVSATQILFNGFYRRYAVLSAQYKEKMSLAERDEVKRLLSWSVAQAFLNTQLAIEDIKIARADMRFNQDQETEAIAKEKSGIGSYSDVLNFKTKVNSARSSLLSAQQALNESLHGLAALMGYKDACLPEGMTVSVMAAETLDRSPALQTDVNARSDTLVSSRPDIKEAWLAVQDAQAGIQMARASYFPTLSLTGSYGTTAADTFADTDSMGAAVGVSLSFDLFSGGAKKARLRQAMAEKRAYESDLLDAKNTAMAHIKASARNITTAMQQLALQKENTRLIEITRDLVKKEFTVGQVSLVRLNEAQTSLVKAQTDLSMARVSLVLAQEEFDYYSGKNINRI